MRKFIFSSAMIGVFAGGWNTLQATRHGPRDWRLLMLWLGWLLSAAVAIGTVIEDAGDRRVSAGTEPGSKGAKKPKATKKR